MFYIKIKKLDVNLKSKDFFSKNDLFVIIKFSGQERKTTTKWDKNHPVWNESFLFEENLEINNKDGYKLDLYVYDEDTWSADEILKRESIKIEKNQSIKQATVCGINIEYGFVKCLSYNNYNELSNKNKIYEKNINNYKKTFDELNLKLKQSENEKNIISSKYSLLKNKIMGIFDDIKSI